MRMFASFLLVLVAAQLSACAWGNKINYQGTSTFRAPHSDQALALAAQDRRPYVLSGNKSEQFVGLRRNLYGMPFGVHTQSGSPLADDLGSLLTETLKKNGLSASQVKIGPKVSAEERLSMLRGSSADKYVVVELKEWKTDGGWSTSFAFDVDLSVLSPTGEQLGFANRQGRRVLSDDEQNNLAASIAAIFDELFADPSVTKALGGEKPRAS